GQRLEIRKGLPSADQVVPWADDRDLAGEPAIGDVLHDDGAERSRPRTAADNREAPWRKNSLESKGGHYAAWKGTAGGYSRNVTRSMARITSSRAIMPTRFRRRSTTGRLLTRCLTSSSSTRCSLVSGSTVTTSLVMISSTVVAMPSV